MPLVESLSASPLSDIYVLCQVRHAGGVGYNPEVGFEQPALPNL